MHGHVVTYAIEPADWPNAWAGLPGPLLAGGDASSDSYCFTE